MTPSIRDIDVADTHVLRRAVLRDGTASDAVVFDGDDEPSTVHLGAFVDGRLVGISTWVDRDWPGRPGHPGRPARQLRGMATDPDHRTRGCGAALLDAGIERCRASGATTIWARARVTVLDFYLHRGFVPVGDAYVDATTEIWHRDVILDLD